MISDFNNPYSRYGLAVALPEGISGESSEVDLRLSLVHAIEAGLEAFRMQTPHNPEFDRELRFVAIAASELRRNPKLIQSAGLATQGKYLFPSVLTTDGGAKDTWTACNELLKALSSNKPSGSHDLKRSIAPMVAKLNFGRQSNSPPKTDLYEAAACAVTALTRWKPAFMADGVNTAVIPDLPSDQLKTFIRIFIRMSESESGALYTAPPRTNGTGNEKPKYRRPAMFHGNFPYAAGTSRFGAIGVLAAIGRWSRSAETDPQAQAQHLLLSICGDEVHSGCPLYVISYKGIHVERFPNHVATLAISGRLDEMIRALIYQVTLRSEIGKSQRFNSNAYEAFWLHANRFLQRFDRAAFRSFLSYRAEYPSKLYPIFEEFFMRTDHQVPRKIVESARAYGQWLNRQAYFAASNILKERSPSGLSDEELNSRIRKEKARILNQLESAALSSKSATEMLHRISTQAGRLQQSDCPPESTAFIVAAAAQDEITDSQARDLVITFMRLISDKKLNNPEQLETLEQITE